MAGYDDIYKAALKATSKKELESSLNKLKKSNKDYNINEKKRDSNTHYAFTAAARLAFESKDNKALTKKVKWLRELGADPSEIAGGYALAGSSGYVKFYRTNFGADANKILRAYVLGGHDKYIGSYVKKYNATPLTVINAYAIRGDKEKCVAYYLKHKEIGLGARAKAMLSGFAEGEHHQYVADSFNESGQYSAPYIVYGYALAGNYSKMDDYLIGAKTNLGEPEGVKFYRSCIDIAGQGLAEGGHHELVEKFLKKIPMPPIKQFEEGYIKGGYPNKAKEYNLKSILDSYLEERTKNKDQYKHMSLPSFFRGYSLKEKTEAITELKKALDGEPNKIKDYLPVLRDGDLGKAIRKFVKAGIAEGLSEDKRVKTVSDLVNELDKKTNKPQPMPEGH
jgi:hypothetical protein